jgi:hypothetical protein
VDNFKSPSLKLTLLFIEQIVHEAQGKSSDLQDSFQGVFVQSGGSCSRASAC